MPKRTPRPCRKCGCPGKTTETHGYCDEHADLASWGKWQKQHGNRHKRGYGRDWELIRKRILERDGYLCQMCLSEGLYTSASHVDHIVPKQKGGTNAESNLQSLCKPCHARKTATERT